MDINLKPSGELTLDRDQLVFSCWLEPASLKKTVRFLQSMTKTTFEKFCYLRSTECNADKQAKQKIDMHTGRQICRLTNMQTDIHSDERA